MKDLTSAFYRQARTELNNIQRSFFLDMNGMRNDRLKVLQSKSRSHLDQVLAKIDVVLTMQIDDEYKFAYALADVCGSLSAGFGVLSDRYIKYGPRNSDTRIEAAGARTVTRFICSMIQTRLMG